MKLSDPTLELQAVVSITASKDPDIPLKLLGSLHKDDFGFEHARAMFKRLKKLARLGKEVPSLKVLKNDASLSDDARDLLRNTTARPVNRMSDVEHLLENLKTYRLARVLYTHHKAVHEKIKAKSTNISAITAEMEDVLFKLKNEASDSVLDHAGDGGNSDELTDEVLNDEDNGDVIYSGYDNFDKPSGGFRKGQFIVIASHKKGGKSVFSLNMAVNQYLKYNLSTCIIPLEMGRKECRQRLLSLISDVPFDKFYKKELTHYDKKKVRKAWKAFNRHGRKNGCRFSIWKPKECTVGDIVFKMKPMEYDCIFVDYVNLLTPTDPSLKGSNDWQVLSTFFKQLKEASTQLNCALFGLTQMNTDGTIRYSGAALEDCDCALTWFYGEEEMATHIVEYTVAVARNFKPFKFHLQEDYAKMQVYDFNGTPPPSTNRPSTGAKGSRHSGDGKGRGDIEPLGL
jgi:replicative DNA helicase